MKRRYKRPTNELQDQIRKRMHNLIHQAENHPDMHDHYIGLIRRYVTRFKVRPDKDVKLRICKHCSRFLIPGKNCRVRTRNGKIIYFCESCRCHMRLPFYRERRQRRRE
ncbi:MAG: ribonuclease P protein component 4 [Nanobdellota archaeon]